MAAPWLVEDEEPTPQAPAQMIFSGGAACTFRIRVDAHAVERMTEPEDVTDDRISARSSE